MIVYENDFKAISGENHCTNNPLNELVNIIPLIEYRNNNRNSFMFIEFVGYSHTIKKLITLCLLAVDILRLLQVFFGPKIRYMCKLLGGHHLFDSKHVSDLDLL